MIIEALNIPKIEDRRGNLSFIEQDQLIPFTIGGVSWFVEAPSGSSLYGQYTADGQDIVVALSGAFEVNDGTQTCWATRPNQGYLIGPGTMYDIDNCSANAVALRISSGTAPAQPQAVSVGNVDACRVVELQSRPTRKGRQIIPVAKGDTAPLLTAKRVYYLYDVPAGAERGGHSHRSISQLLVAVTGSFRVTLDDGRQTREVLLDRPDHGLLITPGIWRTIDRFTAGATCLVLATERYAEADYIREYPQFLSQARTK